MNEDGAYVDGSAVGGARSGTLSRMEVPPLEEGRPVAEGGWYDREGGLGLSRVGKSGDLVPSKRTFNGRLRVPDGPTEPDMEALTVSRRLVGCSSTDTWLLVAVGTSSSRGPTSAAVERSERETNGLVGLVSAALAKRCRAASKASLALARAADRGAGLVGDALSEPGKRRMFAPCEGVLSSS